MKLHEIPHYPFLLWLMFTGLVVFGLCVLWQEGLIHALVSSDRSRISLVILLIYALASLHCAMLVWKLSQEIELTKTAAAIALRVTSGASVHVVGDEVHIDDKQLPDCAATRHVHDLMRARNHEQNATQQSSTADNLLEAFVARLKAPHEVGWFITDVLLKLGLLGTIVGFILMLGSVADTTSLDVNTMQKVLKQMSVGMGTALYTTLAGLVASVSLGLHYLLLDKSADDLTQKTLRLANVTLQPFIQDTPGNSDALVR